MVNLNPFTAEGAEDAEKTRNGVLILTFLHPGLLIVKGFELAIPSYDIPSPLPSLPTDGGYSLVLKGGGSPFQDASSSTYGFSTYYTTLSASYGQREGVLVVHLYSSAPL